MKIRDQVSYCNSLMTSTSGMSLRVRIAPLEHFLLIVFGRTLHAVFQN